MSPFRFISTAINKRLLIVTSSLVVIALGLVAIIQSKSGRKNHAVITPEAVTETGIFMVAFHTKDFPERGIKLISPANASFSKMAAQVMKGTEDSVTDFPPVFLQNTSNRWVAGYRLIWDCVDSAGLSDVTDASNVVSYIFLHGNESRRVEAMSCDARIIKPNSTWLISMDRPARPVESNPSPLTDSIIRGQLQRVSKQCSEITISVDGLFFDDGTFVGRDTTGFFNEVQSQMDARHEILSTVENGLKGGSNVEEILKRLEQIANQPSPQLPQSPSRNEYMNFFRVMFAKDFLGMKKVFGTDKAIEDVHEQLSEPWVHLRRL